MNGITDITMILAVRLALISALAHEPEIVIKKHSLCARMRIKLSSNFPVKDELESVVCFSMYTEMPRATIFFTYSQRDSEETNT